MSGQYGEAAGGAGTALFRWLTLHESGLSCVPTRIGGGGGDRRAVLAVGIAASARDLAMSMHPQPMPTETIMEDAELLHGSATHYYKPPRK